MITNVPRVGNTENNHNSSRFVEDGSYLRLKTVTLSYNFPKKWLNKIHLSRLQAYVTGQNLFTLTKYKGYDPEVNAFWRRLRCSRGGLWYLSSIEGGNFWFEY